MSKEKGGKTKSNDIFPVDQHKCRRGRYTDQQLNDITTVGKKRRGIVTHPPTRLQYHVEQRYYSRTVLQVIALQQKQHVPHPLTHPTTNNSAAARTAAVRGYVRSEVTGASHWVFHIFKIPRLIGDHGRPLSTLPACRVWRLSPFFRRHDLVPPFRRGVARSFGCGRSRGARESHSTTGHSETDQDVKIQNDKAASVRFVSVLRTW